VIFLAGQLVLGALAGAYSVATGARIGNLGLALLEVGSFLVVLPFIRRRLRTRIIPQFRRREPGLAAYLAIVIMAAGAAPAFAVLDSLLNGLVRLPDFFRSIDVFLLNPDDRLGALVLACLAAPVLEETLFRGVILKGLSVTSGATGGLLIAAALFAVVHINPLLFPAAFLLGLLLGTVYQRTGSLVASIVMHALYNAGAIALAWLPGRPAEVLAGAEVPLAAKLGVIGLGLGAAALGAWLLLRATRGRGQA
jgi:membrane protease YdiL (CAAX protease family)